jgi:type IV secretory pathway VirB2 component (pilin)
LQELKKISAARNGEGSLLERFESTRTAVATTKADRGIREKLVSEAANAPKPKAASTFASGSSGKSGSSFNLFGGSSSGPKPAAPKPLAPRPPPTPRPAIAVAPKPAATPAAPKAAAAAPKPAASAAAGGAGAGFGGAVLGPVAQAVGVLGAVAVGANAVTGFATSNKKVSATCHVSSMKLMNFCLGVIGELPSRSGCAIAIVL